MTQNEGATEVLRVQLRRLLIWNQDHQHDAHAESSYLRRN